MTSWLSKVRAEGHEVVVPADPTGECVDLRIGPDRVLLAIGPMITELAWSDHGRQDGWRLCALKHDRGARGAGVMVTGPYIEPTEPFWLATRSWRNRWNKVTSLVPPETPRLIPINGVGRLVASITATRDTVEALCVLLAARPNVRQRMANVETTAQLVADLHAGALPRPFDEHAGIRRETAEIYVAVTQLGFRHELCGRPVPGDALPSLSDATDRVLKYLADSPYSNSIDFNRDHVADLVRSCYLDVKPWPFGSLTE